MIVLGKQLFPPKRLQHTHTCLSQKCRLERSIFQCHTQSITNTCKHFRVCAQLFQCQRTLAFLVTYSESQGVKCSRFLWLHFSKNKQAQNPKQTKTPHLNHQLSRFIARYRQLMGENFPELFFSYQTLHFCILFYAAWI